MKTRTLGSTGLEISSVVFATSVAAIEVRIHSLRPEALRNWPKNENVMIIRHAESEATPTEASPIEAESKAAGH